MVLSFSFDGFSLVLFLLIIFFGEGGGYTLSRIASIVASDNLISDSFCSASNISFT